MNHDPAARDRTLHPSHVAPDPSIEVSAGLLFHAGKLLITQRCADSHLGGLWEFPGGKREAGESFEQCLARELQEELGITVRVGRLWETVNHAYPGKTVHLQFFLCQLIAGDPQPLGCAALRWIGQSELDDMAFPPADARLLVRLKCDSTLWQPAA